MSGVDLDAWDVLGTAQILSEAGGPGSRGSLSIPIEKEGKYRRFRIVAHGWAMNIVGLRVDLDGNEEWEPPIRGLLLADSASDIVDIPGAPRTITGVELTLANVTAGKGALVYVWGKR